MIFVDFATVNKYSFIHSFIHSFQGGGMQFETHNHAKLALLSNDLHSYICFDFEERAKP